MSDALLWALAIAAGLGVTGFGAIYLRRKGLGSRRTLTAYGALCALALAAGLIFRPPARVTLGFYPLMPGLLLISLEDLARRRIANRLLLGLTVIGLAAAALCHERFLTRVLALGIYGGIFALVSLVTRGKFGMGDAKLCGVVGLFFGLVEMFTVLFLASVFACLAGLAVALRTHDLRREIPFAPAMTAAALIAVGFGWF